eukprot:6174817-Pleurochrysis_carterae.AAC.1
MYVRIPQTQPLWNKAINDWWDTCCIESMDFFGLLWTSAVRQVVPIKSTIPRRRQEIRRLRPCGKSSQ